MRSSKQYAVLFTFALLIVAAAANAAHVDMSDPRRALGREDDVRIDAQLAQDTLSPNSAVSVTYQIENLSNRAIAVADRTVDVSFDPDERTLNVVIGAEALSGKALPHIVVIAPGEQKTFTAGGVIKGVQSVHGPFAVVPRYVQIRVNVLRDIAPFREAIAKQIESPAANVAVTNEMFDKWLDANDSISLNALPIRWSATAARAVMSAEDSGPVRAGGGTW